MLKYILHSNIHYVIVQNISYFVVSTEIVFLVKSQLNRLRIPRDKSSFDSCSFFLAYQHVSFTRIDVKKLHEHCVCGAFWKNLMLELQIPSGIRHNTGGQVV